ncbi:uncharacterized protein ELE39_002302 [Cryptosporidium sp. chipmunk genotype I]|uniref:uncharacterized protein n=1 Tax=Cryptosporidium sp. chipmunk genotype I TaxID=1280935 RepID=UPI003519DF20|nr:hypothetical protein ELE39_002302 [Cryptosporidium sp. chipmunk genotype I]
MLNIQFEGSANYPSTSHPVKEMVKLFDIKSNDFNNTISTVNSDSYYFEKNFKTSNKQNSKNPNNKNKVKKAVDPPQSSLLIDQDYYEIFDPVYPSMSNIFKQKIKKKNCPKENSKANDINNKTLSNFKQNQYYNNHVIKNYLNYLWQVGDEFSEIHCFPFF